MDPNANLDEQRRIITGLAIAAGSDRVRKLERLAELAEALDDWVSGGGFLPDAWAAAFSLRRAER